MILTLLGAQGAAAQRNVEAAVNVSVRNLGHFGCTFNTERFDFGDLDASGAVFGTPNVVSKGRSASKAGTAYENTAGSIVWSCRAAPRSTIDIALVSTGGDHTGGMQADDLEVRLASSQGGTSTGFQAFTSQAPLLTGLSVGNGANAVSGTLDLLLTVLDADPPGVNTWVVRLRAASTP